MSSRIAPLTDFTKDTFTFTWTSAHQDIVNSIIHQLTNDSYLVQPDLTKPFQLYTDASGYGIGVLLLQDTQTGECRGLIQK